MFNISLRIWAAYCSICSRKLVVPPLRRMLLAVPPARSCDFSQPFLVALVLLRRALLRFRQGAGSVDARLRLASRVGCTSCGAVEPHHCLESRLRPRQASHCQHRAPAKYPIARKYCGCGRLTTIFRFNLIWALSCYCLKPSSVHIRRPSRYRTSRFRISHTPVESFLF